jgi:hypothetical protein
MDFDINDLKRKYTLALDQKLNLELNLKKFLPFVQEQILKRFVSIYIKSEKEFLMMNIQLGA